MASPPYNTNYTAHSPPYPSHTSLPNPKRRQSDMPSSAPLIKRRKASMLSTTSATSSLHPLRQTSFPPESSNPALTPNFSRSPSMDTMSIVSGSVAGGLSSKKKKPRKSKGGKDDAGRGKSMMSDSRKGKSREISEEVEEEEEGGDEMALESAAASKEEKAKEDRKRQILVSAFESDQDQFNRYAAWRASKLPDAVVRRIVNQTLSQSVPPNVILAIKSAAKIYAGELIEGARRVQTQWIEAGEPQLPDPVPAGIIERKPETRRAPLLPDHLREAHRRHVVEGDGGLVGQLGLWQAQQHSGVERFALKAGGKRLFK